MSPNLNQLKLFVEFFESEYIYQEAMADLSTSKQHSRAYHFVTAIQVEITGIRKRHSNYGEKSTHLKEL